MIHMPMNQTASDVVDVLEALGVPPARVDGDEVWACCPQHEERVGKPDNKPSWSINAKTGVHHCFSCGYAGTLVGLVADMLNMDGGQARRWLRHSGADLEAAASLPPVWQRPTATPRKRIPEEALQGFVLPPEAAMQQRKVSHTAVNHYGVMWDPDRRGWILPIRYRDGVLLGYQFKKRSVVLNEPRRLQVKKSHTLFGIDVFSGGRAILVESPLDCLYLHSIGVPNVLATMGSRVSEDQMRLVLEHADQVILALDNDPAGRKETKRLVMGREWKRGGWVQQTKWFKRLPLFIFDYGENEGKDPGELAPVEVRRGLLHARYMLEWE